MFQHVELAWSNQIIGLDSAAEEFNIISDFNPADLLIHQLLKQLKINVVQTGFTFQDEKLILLQNIPETVEWVDETPRFLFPKQEVLNLKELFLFQKMKDCITANSQFNLGLKWGKKQTFIFELRLIDQDEKNVNSFERTYINKLIDTLSNGDKEVLNERFKILMNASFLNKLKTYYLFWIKKYQLNTSVPNWFEKLYLL